MRMYRFCSPLDKPHRRSCGSVAVAWNHLHIDLNSLSGIGHLFIRFGLIGWFCLRLREKPQFAHDAKQAFRTAYIASFSQLVPKFHHSESGIAATYVFNQFQFFLCVLIEMAVRPLGLVCQRLYSPVPARFPELDV